LELKKEFDTTYWEDFSSTYTADDFARFIDEIVTQSSSLSNIALFTFIPDIESSFHNYPVETKLEELKHISKADRQCLYEMMNKEKGMIGDHLHFLNEMFHVVEATIKNKFRCSDIPFKDIFAKNSFHRIVSWKYPKGKRQLVRYVGLRYPIYVVTWETVQENEQVRSICHMNFISPPPNLKNERNEWEEHSLRSYKIFNKDRGKDNILFGSDLTENHSVVYYFRGKKLSFPITDNGDFIYPIGQRYKPLLNKEFWRAQKLGLFDISFISEREGYNKTLEEELRKLIGSYKKEKGYFATHAKLGLMGYNTGKFRHRSYSTTKVRKKCTENKIKVWRNCRYKRPKDKDNPECERRKNGFCKHPEAKRKTLKQKKSEEEVTNCDQSLDHREFNEREHQVDEELIERNENFLLNITDEDSLCPASNDSDYKLKRIESAATDKIDKAILECLRTGDYKFKSEDASDINYSAVAREIGVSYMTVQRRLIKLISKAKNK